jgi:hypothetical protein
LWSFNFGGQAYSFQINTVSYALQSIPPTTPVDYIDISGTGTGTIKPTGVSTNVPYYLPTTEDWSITGTTTAGGLTINIGNSVNAIPEPSTFAFAGLGGLLSFAALFRRK